VFRSDLNREATALALMTQIKGIAHHAAMRERQPGEIDLILFTVAAQVEHWLTCQTLLPASGKKKVVRRSAAARPSKSSVAKTGRHSRASQSRDRATHSGDKR
jgi:hypothetical protein